MKKLFSVVALLLIAAMLLSSCSVNLAKQDMSAYINVADGIHTNIKVTVDRTNLYKETVRNAIYEALRGSEKTVLTEGEIKKYDTVQLYTIAFNQEGKVVLSSFGVSMDSSGKVTGFDAPEDIAIGFDANRELIAEIEKSIMGEDVKTHLISTTTTAKDKIADHSYMIVTYKGYKMDDTGKADTSTTVKNVSSPDIIVGNLYITSDVFRDNFKNENGESTFVKDEYHAAICKAVAAINAAVEKGATITDTLATSIYVYPEGTAIPEGKETDATTAYINANVNFDTTNDTKDADGNVTEVVYDPGVIYVTFHGAATPKDGAAAIEILDKTIYEKDEETEEDEDALEGPLDILVYLVSTTRYPDMIEYDEPTTEAEITALRTFLKKALEKAEITPESDDIDALKAQYEKYMYEDLDKKAGFSVKAEDEAIESIWQELLKNKGVTVLKYAEANVRAYVKDQEEILEYMYYHGEIPSYGYMHSWSVYQGKIDKNGFSFASGVVTDTPAAETGKFKNWKEYAVDQYQKDGTLDSKKEYTYSAVRSLLYEDGYAREKEMMLVYYMADKLNIEIDDERYAQLIKADAEAWIKNQKDSYKEYYGYTPTITTEDYEEYMGGRDNLRSAHLMILVQKELLKITEEKGGLTYNEVYQDGSKVSEAK